MLKPDTTPAADNKKDLARFILEQLKEGRLDKARALGFLQELSAQPATDAGPQCGDIAIIGVACRFPDAGSKDAFWDNLMAGRSSMGPFPQARRDDLGALDAHKTELFKGGFLEQVDSFDNEYFNIPPAVARHMDPYQRLLLETFVETIEDAGYHRAALHGKPVGVFVGNDHTHRLFNSYVDFIDDIDFNSVTGSWTAVLASRISYLFNLKGPALVIDTACSSGLVALDNAIKALRDGDCESALVGAANLFFAPGKGLVGDIENDDFQVRAFDKRASGTAWGEGVAAVMLKPLAQALRDGDPIHAIVKSLALNNDGASNGLTAPNAKAQQDVILKAWERGGVDPDDISYIETHGTGTHLGDPIEIKGLTEAFARHSARKQFCAIGSVKTNIGHTVGVAGLASLIKVVMSFQHRAIPPSINFSEPNPFIDFCNSPVYVNDRVLAWPSGAKPRMAGISSFSLSGTNCHLVLQEPPVPAAAAPSAGPQIIALSGRSRELLAESVRRLQRRMAGGSDAGLADIAFTSATGREHHAVRAALIAADHKQLAAGLERLLGLIDSGAAHGDGHTLFWRLDAAAARPGGREERDSAMQSARQGQPEGLRALARLYVDGAAIKWEPLYEGTQRRRVSLPAQPFVRRRFWDKAPVTAAAAAVAGSAAPETSGRLPTRAELIATVRSEAPRLLGSEHLGHALPYQLVARIWSEVLGYPELELKSDFYALGGDSITGTRIIHLLNAIFGIGAGIADLLGAPDLESFVDGLIGKYDFGHQADADAAPAMRAAAASGVHGLSRAQTRMLLLDRLAPGRTVYNVNAVVRLPALPDLAQTARIMGRIIERHEILRTSYEMRDGQPVQLVHASAAFAAELIELESGDHAALETALAAFIRPFDLARPPLLRAGFLRAPSGECWLALDMHHIATDGSSMGILVREFLALQSGDALTPLPFQYKDFAAWQNQQFASGAYQDQQAYWMQQFADGGVVSELPTDFQRPAYQDFRGARQRLVLAPALAQRLQQVARSHGTTLFVVLLASFKALLYRLGAGSDLVLGTPVAGRSRHELHELIGMFVNTLALRNQVQAGDSFAQLLGRVKGSTLAALAHQDYPYEELVEGLAVQREASRNPLFDIYFVLQNEDMGLEAEGGVSTVAFDSGSAKFDMTVVARVTPQGIEVDWEYATALYRAATIARMGAQWSMLLDAVAAEPACSVDQIDLFSEHERALLVTANDTASAYPSERGLASLFEERAARDGNADALEMDGVCISYAQLNARANRLAHRLLAAGAAPGAIVGLLFDRSPSMIVSILAVLKAGCAYLPLDLDNPADRSGAMLADSGSVLLLAGEGLDIPDGVNVIYPDAEDLSGYPDSNPGMESGGTALAYVIYTSGSTGTPKGSLISHRSAARVVCDTNYITMSAADRVLQLSNYAFDGSVFDLWAALLHGGCLVLLHKRELLDLDALARTITERRISVFFITTSLFNVLVDTRLSCLAGVRHVLFGGEAASLHHVRRAIEVLGDGVLINGYGPTETTVFACARALCKADLAYEAVPIGRPIGNTSCYVLDERMQPAPFGAVGELYIGGDGVALGYLGQPELTGEKFMDDPFRPGQRMYRSGDLVKWTDSGLLFCIGRRDQQVKIRGFRIELGEIEAAIGRHPNVRECLVSADAGAGGRKQLCAYVVANTPGPDFAQQLKEFLAGSLPDYMVPAAMVVMDAFPLNRNGKIDRAALPAPHSGVDPEREMVAPRNEREQVLAALWRELLGVEQVSIHDNFFALGGDSIKAIQIVARLQESGYLTDMPQLFQHQSIAALAAKLIEAGTGAEQGPVTGTLPVSAPQRAWLEQPESTSAPAHMMLVPCACSLAEAAGALTALCSHHDGLRMRVRQGADGWEAAIGQPSASDWRLIESEAGLPAQGLQALLDPANGPLLAAQLRADGVYIALHQLAADHGSAQIVHDDFVACLAALQAGQAPKLAPKTDSLPSCHAALQEHAAGAQPQAALQHRSELAAHAALHLFAPVQGTPQPALHRLVLDAGLSARLAGDANRAYSTEPRELLLAAVGQAVALWRGTGACLVQLQSDTRRALPALAGAGRTVGQLTCFFPFLLAPPDDPAGAIAATKDALRRIAGMGTGFALRADGPHADIRPQLGVHWQDGPASATPHPHQPPLDVLARWDGERVELALRHDRRLLDGAAVEHFASLLAARLEALALHCGALDTVQKTASDFSAGDLAQDELDDIFADLNIV